MASDAAHPAPVRVTRRRAETRNRLLTAAYETFAEEGFGRATVERVCERAGFTRGAFYSNFSSLDELFLAMWEQRSTAMLAEAGGILDEIAADGTEDVRTAVEQLERAVPIDAGWYRITAEFTAYALRTPALRRVMVAREEAIVAALMPTIVAALTRAGRSVSDPEGFGQALIAVHDGTSVQILLEPDSHVVRARRTELFHHVVLAYSTATEG
ncbi:TetR/AcrR family transcriptional regulator [Nocardia sp. 004]|uniref:TetR/AcrR family transcriptional regulator n=1 Tax=Nocardia sp. 004 TaxID=3385978 RepID=UPI0039A15D01